MERSLPGYRGVRAELLAAIKRSQPVTVQELSRQFGMTPNGLRRHLKSLEEDGVIAGDRVPRGVGAPAFAYRLTADGEGLFPHQYVTALADALDAVREHAGTPGLLAVFRKRWAAIAAEAEPALATLTVPERTRLLAEVLSAEGYMAEAEDAPGGVRLREHHCAVRAVAEKYPEVCAAEAEFLTQMLGAPVARETHILAGCNACQYTVQLERAPAPAGAPTP
jgi:DeoR family suf operon transcriptional repressor